MRQENVHSNSVLKDVERCTHVICVQWYTVCSFPQATYSKVLVIILGHNAQLFH